MDQDPPPVGIGASLRAERRAHATRQIAFGAVLVVVGIIITAATYGSASHGSGGGTYIIAYGPIIFGVIRMVRGLANLGG